jgi:DNA-binding response OmpR family regulator
MTRFRLLLVEDDVLVRASLAEYLRDCGYEVLEAIGGDEARRLFTLGGKPITVVLANANASGEGGFGLAAWIRDVHPDVNFIMTGSVAKATGKVGDLCQEGPAQSVPYDHSVLLDRIRRLMAARERQPH